jgi:hypothetical protein
MSVKAWIRRSLLPGNSVLSSARELAADLKLGRKTVIAAHGPTKPNELVYGGAGACQTAS